MPGLRPTSLFHRSVVLLFVLASGIAVVGSPAPARAAAGDLVIDGRGWGHGVGLAQDGALAMGRAGADVGQILDHFYPGTTDGSAGGMVRVVVSTGPARQTVVSFPDGGQLRAPGSGPQPQGFPIAVPPSTEVVVSVDGGRTVVRHPPGQPQVRTASIHTDAAPVVLAAVGASGPSVDASSGSTTSTRPTTTTGPPPPTVGRPDPRPANPPPPPSRPAAPASPPPPVAPTPAGEDPAPAIAGPVAAVPSPGGTALLVDRQRRYRGALEIGDTAGVVRVVNELDVEDYLRGMGEVREPSWPPAALQAQAVAARTYALHAMAADGEICADDRCQVYLSADVEYPAMDDAIRTTRSRVRRTGTELATTFYSANGGGVSATPEEGFGPGGSDLPYLRADPYPTDDPDPWTVRADLAETGRRFAYPGLVSRVRVSRAGPSGRALEVTLEGDSGPAVVSGQSFAARLQLRSTLFSIGIGGDQRVEGLVPVAPMTPAGPDPALLGPRLDPARAQPNGFAGASATRRVVLAVLIVVTIVMEHRRRGWRSHRRLGHF